MLDSADDFIQLIYTVQEIAKADQESDLSDLLLNGRLTIQQTEYDNWNGGSYGYTVVSFPVFRTVAN